MEQKLIILLNRDAPQEAIEAWKSLRTNFYTDKGFMMTFFELTLNFYETNTDMKVQEIGGLYDSQKQINSNFDSVQEKEFCNVDHMGKFGNLGFLLSGEWETLEIKNISNALIATTQHYLGYTCVSTFLITEILQ